VGALGVALVLLVSVAWGTGLLYLIVRIGLPSPVRLAVVDAIHVYVGLASIAFLAAKVSRVGFHERVAGVTGVVLWHRWVSGSMLVLYGAVYATGLLLLPRWPAGLRESLVNAHLLAAVWAAVPTSWHVWHYRSWARPYLPPPWQLPLRCSVGLVIALLPAAAIVNMSRALSPLTQIGAGTAWTAAGPRIFFDRLGVEPNGRGLLAGGQALYLSDDAGQHWHRLEFPPDLVLGLALPSGPVAAYVGTLGGLYASPRLQGPYRRLALPSFEVHAVAVDPHDREVVWASSRGGFWRSPDGGEHWTAESIGLREPETAWALTYFAGTVWGSDASAVYRWNGSAWDRTSDQRFVVSLDLTADGQRLFASSMGQGIRVFDGHRWHRSDDGLATNHGGSGAIHIASVTEAPDGRMYAATMLDGVAISLDGGRSWARLRGGPPRGSVWRVLPQANGLVAADDRGLYAYSVPQTRSAAVGWWTVVAATALLAGAMGVAVVALPRRW